MEQNTYEQEIDLKDLMFAVLRRWRIIIAAAVVLAVVLGGYRAFSVYKSQNDAAAIQTAQEEYEEAQELYEKNVANCEREVDNLIATIEEQQNYLEKSLLMNMSPYDVWESKKVLFIKTDYQIMPDMVYQNLNYTDTILASYRTGLTNLEFLAAVAESVGMEERYLAELVTVSAGDNLLTLQVRGESEATATAIMEQLLDGVEHLQKQIKKGIGDHTVTEVSSSLGSLVDLTLLDTQKTQSDRLRTLNESLTAKQEELAALAEPTAPSSSRMEAVKAGVKYAVLGGVLGAFLVVFFVCVGFLMSDKLYSAKELKNRYRVKILGTLPLAGGRKLFFVDAWLRKMEGRADGKDEAVEYGLIAANISNYASDVRNILVIGTAGGKQVAAVAENLTGRLNGVKVVTGGNMLRDEQTLRELPECDGVVLVEQCGASSYSDVGMEIEKTRDLKKAVIGCVVFE